MKEVGKILHFTKSRFYVIPSKFKVLPQTSLYNSSGREVAVAIDLIGPIDKPFIIAKPKLKSPEKIVNATLYVRMEKRKKL